MSLRRVVSRFWLAGCQDACSSKSICCRDVLAVVAVAVAVAVAVGGGGGGGGGGGDRKSTRLNSSHPSRSRMPSSA